MMPQHHLPADIERTSMKIITGELAQRGLDIPPENAPVVKRVIHTTADFDYAQTLHFTPGAVAAGIAAMHAGATIITDTNMALAGITKPGLAKLGGQALCFMADPAVAAAAKQAGTTRAVAAMHKAAAEYPGAVLAVGNAPTALLTIAEKIENGLRPALVIGVPVGFVNVVESKEEILALASDPQGGAKPGDWVEVEPASGSAIGFALLVFFLPCVFLLGGYLIGRLLGLGDGGSIGMAAAGLVLGFVPAVLINRTITRRKTPEFTVLGYLHSV